MLALPRVLELEYKLVVEAKPEIYKLVVVAEVPVAVVKIKVLKFPLVPKTLVPKSEVVVAAPRLANELKRLVNVPVVENNDVEVELVVVA